PPPLWWDTNQDGTVDADDRPLQLDDGVDDLGGLTLQIGRQVGGRFGIGLSAYLPVQRLFRLHTFEPSLPTYIQLNNRSQRYVLAAGAGGEVLPGVSIGVAADVVPRVRFSVGMTADVTVSEDDEADDLGDLVSDVVVDVHEITLDVIPGVAPVVGLQLDLGRWHRKLRGLALGASWRGALGVPIDGQLDIQANLHAEDVGSLDPFTLAGVIDARLFLFDHYVPMKVDFGASYTLDPWVWGYVDARWTDWRRMLLSVARVEQATLTTPLVDLGDVIRDGNDYALDLRATWGVRGGAGIHFPRFELDSRARYVQLSTSAGAGWEQTPLVSQGASSAFLDSDRWWLSGGVSVETWDPFNLFNGPLRFDLFFQYQRLVPAQLTRTSDGPQAGYPIDGAPIPVGGSILALGGAVGFEY
ncbi:MAG TPA: hypothetical protein PKA64_25240, partial [Myxococcota bacterium]|nr:hypothetical protein [Myxococcota bacterium]